MKTITQPQAKEPVRIRFKKLFYFSQISQIFVCSPLSFIIFHLAKRLLLPPCYPTPVGQPILPFQCRIAPTRKYSGGHIYIICTHAMRRRQRWGALTYCEQVKHRTQVLYETQAGVQAGGQLRRTREGTRPRTLEVEKKVKQQTLFTINIIY